MIDPVNAWLGVPKLPPAGFYDNIVAPLSRAEFSATIAVMARIGPMLWLRKITPRPTLLKDFWRDWPMVPRDSVFDSKVKN